MSILPSVRIRTDERVNDGWRVDALVNDRKHNKKPSMYMYKILTCNDVKLLFRH